MATLISNWSNNNWGVIFWFFSINLQVKYEKIHHVHKSYEINLVFCVRLTAFSSNICANNFWGYQPYQTDVSEVSIIVDFNIYTSLWNRCLLLLMYYAAYGRRQSVWSPIRLQPCTVLLNLATQPFVQIFCFLIFVYIPLFLIQIFVEFLKNWC